MKMRMVKVMGSLISYLSSSELVAGFQRACGLHAPRDLAESARRIRSSAKGSAGIRAEENGHAKPEVRNRLLYLLFVGSAALGNEIFYITFLPLIHWNLDPFLCRRLVNMWAVVMYIGQVMKDMLKLPRPTSPPVVKLEERVEYGMPSTHAMAATAIAFTLLLSAPERVQFQFEAGLGVAVLLSALVSLSRLYTGMHSALDVICGALISALIMGVSYPFWHTVDHLQLHSALSPVVSSLLPLVLCYKYPDLGHYSATRKDTAIILGASAGCSIGYWLNQRLGVTFEPVGPFPITLPPLTLRRVALGAGRFVVGVPILLLTRQLVHWGALWLLCWHHRVAASDGDARRRREIEVPHMLSTYSAVGLMNSVVVCRVFQLVGVM